ncbi:hypothetical protein N9Z85_06700 [Akkermansiaceae bacterium]|nr:hypothetical protein [Akkermansiaceae bacterium]
MSVTWEYHFPSMIFKADRVCQKNEDGNVEGNLADWNPEEDFKNYLESLAVEAKWFESEEWAAVRFEEARGEMLARIEITSEGEGDEYYKEEWDEDAETGYEVSFPRWRISFKEFAGELLLSNGKQHHVYAQKNAFHVHKTPQINLLFDWLFSVRPYGGYDNDFYIGAYGVTEYDDTTTANYQFISGEQGTLLLQSAYIRAVKPKDDDSFSFDSNEITPRHETAAAIKSWVGKMHPSGEIAEWKGCQP